ncbi:MFS transporter [Bdellovibrio bacteriovorus]|uniref:MFS transporter n=1 Tax=Bdellovibrio bacteriovorus TaxID=959 RepID=UPI0035A67233
MTSQNAGWKDLLSGKNGIYSVALAGGVTLHALNMYIAITIMPSAVKEIGGLAFYAWTTTLFVIASILGAALTAKLLKNSGPRGAYVIATALFTAGTLICTLAPSMMVMLIGRSLQGLGGGFLYALAYGVTRLVFPENLWGRSIGLISAMFGIATLVGPAVGGLFAQQNAWRTAFGSLIPIAVLFALLAFFTLPKKSDDKSADSPIPYLQLLFLSGAVLAVSTGSLSENMTWKIAGLVGALAMIGLIAIAESTSSARLLPKNSFSLSSPLGVIYFLIALLMLSMQPEIFVPYLLQNLHAQSPLWAGYLGAFMAIGWTVASFLSSKWQDKGDRLVLLGPALVLGGLVLLAVFLPQQSTGQWTLLAPICVGLILVGFGIGLAWPSLVSRVFQNAPTDEQGLAAGGMTTVQLFAIAFGAASAGMVANFAGLSNPGGVTGAASAAFWLMCLFGVIPAICLIIALRAIRLTAKV